MNHIVRGRQGDAPMGGKARALAVLQDAGLPVPPWFVVVPSAFDASLGVERGKRLQKATTGEAMRDVINGVELSAIVRNELRHGLAELASNGEPVAVRSSASDEDGPRHSFAGQLDSFLFVPPDRVADRVIDVWRSGFSDRVVAYRSENGLPLTPRPPAVLVQRMINADVAGVAFGADPVSGQRGVAVVSAVLGLGTALVGGDVDADTWRVDRDGRIVEHHRAAKTEMHVADRDGVRTVSVPLEKVHAPALTDAQAAEVAELARRAGNHFGTPQDIEWAYAGGKLYLLQSRPITSLADLPDPDGTRNIWDNSNIAESYSGITTPLTFTFARKAYEEVYRQFCRLLGVPEAVIAASAGVFRRMLGLVRGRVYYNLLNWYRLIALLPGFKSNRGFMEQMMGVKEPLPDDVVTGLSAATWSERMRDSMRLWGSMMAMVRHHWTLSGQIRRFHERLNQALGTTRPDLSRLRPDEIVAYYRDLERQLLTRWDAPLLNDFFAMIFFGVLGKLCQNWCGDVALRNDLIGGGGGMISAEPARRVREMAAVASAHPPLIEALCGGGLHDVVAIAPPEFRRLLSEYLEKFGDRCLEELKLESSTLFDDPTLLLRSVGQLARGDAQREGEAPAEPSSPTSSAEEDKADSAGEVGSAGASPSRGGAGAPPRADAEARVAKALRGNPWRQMMFSWVLKNARARVRDRENLRFERTRLFGRVRLIFTELGRQFHARGLLDEPRDVFYLEADEVLGFIEGTASCTDLRGLAAVRKAEFERYRQMPPPADRFETRGLVYVGHDFARRIEGAITEGEERSGLGCCPGVVRGIVRVILDPRGAELRRGEVLVAERTDPGWVMLFPAAAGLLVERGSLLSHSAIVAREMGIPAVVSVPGITAWLATGDEVEMDGARGVVRRLKRGEGP